MLVDLTDIDDAADTELVPPFRKPLLRDEAGTCNHVEMGISALVELPHLDILKGAELALDGCGKGAPSLADSLDCFARRREPLGVTRERKELVGLTSADNFAPLCNLYWPTDRTLP